MTTKKQLEAALIRIERIEDAISQLMWASHEWPRQLALDFDKKTFELRRNKLVKWRPK